MGPQRFAAVMGTGTLATCTERLAVFAPGLPAGALRITSRALRRGMTSGLGGWSFSFPVGTMSLGLSAFGTPVGTAWPHAAGAAPPSLPLNRARDSSSGREAHGHGARNRCARPTGRGSVRWRRMPGRR